MARDRFSRHWILGVGGAVALGGLAALAAGSEAAPMAALTQLPAAVFGAFVERVPVAAYLVGHPVGAAVGAFFTYRALINGSARLGVAFALYVLSELFYFSYHAGWTDYLFAHTAAELLDFTTIVLVFLSSDPIRAGQRLRPSPDSAARGE